jgi:antitoxin Phd
MRIYTYSEARQNLSSVMDEAISTGKVIIRRKDGRTLALIPERTRCSPLDVPSINANVTTKELVNIVRKGRSKTSRSFTKRTKEG